MKCILKFGIVAFLLIFGSSAYGQLDIKIQAGAGLSYSTDISAIGLHLRGNAHITEEWGGSVNTIIYFDSDINWWELNFDAHYHFPLDEGLVVYPLAGINITTFNYKNDLPFIGELKGSDAGLNVGGGATYALTDVISLFGELKFVIGGGGRLVLSAGGLYAF